MDLIVFPNQLFQMHPGLQLEPNRVVLIEDSLFFGDHYYPEKFHLQKIWLLRTAMKRYEADLQAKGWQTVYLEHDQSEGSLFSHLESISDRRKKVRHWATIEPFDFMLRKRIEKYAAQLGSNIQFLVNPGFLNSQEINAKYRAERKRWFMADFYKFQRRRLDVLMENDQPVGGKWSFDEENRKKIPKKLQGTAPPLPTVKVDSVAEAARKHVQKNYKGHPGNLSQSLYPTSHKEAEKWLKDFLKKRFELFGDYEDAIEQGESFLWHSVLTPMLNIGLLTPHQLIDEVQLHLENNDVPINSVEGFVRQIIGWREFIRATYDDLGVKMRTSNHWDHRNAMPCQFYEASTGIEPIDDCIQRILDTGYCHHIERLMVLGGFMFLCEIEPNEIYRWFMEMFVDSYDWVMVPNVYSMSQHADGGLITTKPYFSGSAYIRKMSHYPKGPWCEVWDGLYWRWISKNRERLVKNPRWAMMCRSVEKMDAEKLKSHLDNAEGFLNKIF